MTRKKTRRTSPTKVQNTVRKNILKRIRNYLILSVVMMFVGGTGERYKTEIIDFVKSKYKEYISCAERTKTHSSKFIKESISNIDHDDKSINRSKNYRNNSNRPSEIIRHKYFTLSYNENWEQPNWVAYTLTKDMISKKYANRSNNFRVDPLVKTGSSTVGDYRNSGYDRGHLCPAAAMAFSKIAMSETFYMSNMSPQKPGFNRGVWKALEKKVRKWTLKNKEISVVSGPIFYRNRNHKNIGNNEVGVPDAFYKVILDNKRPGIKAIGFILPNQKTYKSPYNFAVSVDTVESITGIDFFTFLPDNIETEIERENNYRQWL